MARGYNKLVGEQMEVAAREAFLRLENKLEGMSDEELHGARVVIAYFKDNYMQAGYKKLARKLVKFDVDA